MIDENVYKIALEAPKGKGLTVEDGVRLFLETYLSKLPKPQSPYEQAILYRKLVGME